MSETKIASDVFKINSPIEDVYSFLSDFNRIGVMVNMAKQMGIGSTVGGEQLEKLTEKIEAVRFNEDSCFVTLKEAGEMAVKIVEKEYPKLIKLGGEGCVPFDFNVWIQLLDNGPYDTRVKITFQAELNMMMKMLLKGKLEKGINQLCEGLTKIPYSMLK